MQIRSITFFGNTLDNLHPIENAVGDARAVLEAAGYSLQTIRMATTPFPGWLESPTQLPKWTSWCETAGFDYLGLGPVQLIHTPDHLDWLPAIIGANDMVFASAEIADTGGRIDTGRAARVAALMRELAVLRADGFANLYFTAAANCPAGSPFFPVAYHDGGQAGFAIATEAADLAVDAFQAADSLAAARTNLVTAIEQEAAKLVAVAEGIADPHGLAFGGLDFSLAPFPEDARSIGTAIEALGVPAVGGHGSLFAAAFLTDCVDQARFPRCGFSSLMLPVLEDSTLARRAAEGIVTVNDLLLYSAVCGTGLDTIPLPGDVSEKDLTGILLDLAALAVRLDKPLTARLMPLPGLETGDPVLFEFPFFANSQVMPTKAAGLTGTLSRHERIVLQPR